MTAQIALLDPKARSASLRRKPDAILDTAWTRLLYRDAIAGAARQARAKHACTACEAPMRALPIVPSGVQRERTGVMTSVLLVCCAGVQIALAAALLVPLQSDALARAAILASVRAPAPLIDVR